MSTVVLDDVRKRSGKDGRQTERKSETKKTIKMHRLPVAVCKASGSFKMSLLPQKKFSHVYTNKRRSEMTPTFAAVSKTTTMRSERPRSSKRKQRKRFFFAFASLFVSQETDDVKNEEEFEDAFRIDFEIEKKTVVFFVVCRRSRRLRERLRATVFRSTADEGRVVLFFRRGGRVRASARATSAFFDEYIEEDVSDRQRARLATGGFGGREEKCLVFFVVDGEEKRESGECFFCHHREKTSKKWRRSSTAVKCFFSPPRWR